MRRAIPILILALALLAAGCGGSDDTAGTTATTASTDTTATDTAATVGRGRLQRRQGAEGARGRRRDEAEGAPRSREDVQARVQDQLRLVHGHARSGQGARHVGLARLAREVRLLRQHDLPPHRAGLRDPGRRSDAGRERRAGIFRPSIRRPPTRSTPRGSSRWPRREPRRRGTSGSQFFVVSGPNAATLPPDYAIVGNVTSGMDTVKRIDGFGDVNDPSGTPARPVVVESVTVEES